MDNLNQELRKLTKHTILTSLNLTDKIDDVTNRILGRQCGGKGYYQHCDLTAGKITTEIVNCECEGGYTYGIS